MTQAIRSRTGRQRRRSGPRILLSVAYGIAAVDRDLRYVYANDAALAMVGMPLDRVLGSTPVEIFPAPLGEMVSAQARQVLESGQPLTYDVYYEAAGRWYENRLFPSQGGVVAFFSDITDRKHAEQELRTSEASHRRLAAALRESGDVLSLAMRGGRMGAWSRNLVTGEVWWSRELEEIFGLSPGRFDGTLPGYLEFVHEADRQAVKEAVDRAIAARTDYVVEFRFRHAGGDWRWMEGRGAAIYDAAGTPLSLYGVGIDITARKHADEAVAAARSAAAEDAARLSVALSAARLGDWHWDAVTDAVSLSSRAAELFGLPPDTEVTWAALRERLHPDDQEGARRAVERAVATHRDYSFEYRVVIGDRERWIRASGRASYDASGTVTGMYGVVHDISHDRMLVRLDDAVRSRVSADAITHTAATFLGNHLLVNRCAYAIVEADEDNFILTGNYTRDTHSIVGRYRFTQFGAECHRLMRAGEPYVVEDASRDERITADDRAAYDLTAIRAVICVPILKEGRFVAAMAVHTTTPRLWHRDEVELVQQVASRCWESLERARVERERAGLLQAAEAANRAKDEFMAMLGHELRNPLSPILTALQLMRRRGDNTLDRERRVIERQVSHLTRLVDDLLDVSRIARGKVDLKIETIDLAEILDRAVETASPLLEERSHTLEADVPRGMLVVRGDPARLTQVFSNLLTNAAKYTPGGGRIAVTAARDAGEAVVRITDSGVGMDETILPHIFEAFAQGPQLLDRAQGGLGLGLSIARSLAERHGGSISARSEGVGAGSEFVVRLPLSAGNVTASAPVARASTQAEAPGAGRRVLIVDDNRDGAEMMAAALTLRGFDVRTAHDGLAALDVAAAFGPELAVLDIGLPVMDGYELAARLRQTPGLERLRLIAVTGYGQKSDRERSAAAGFDQHIVKPVDADGLIELALNLPPPSSSERAAS